MIFKRLSSIKLPFTSIRRLLLAIFAGLGLYLIADSLIYNAKRIKDRVLSFRAERASVTETLDVLKERGEAQLVRPADYYSGPVKARNIFTAKGAGILEIMPSTSLKTMVSQFRLLGIVSGPDPQAIIEDIRNKEVYFISPGECIGDGEIELKKILPGKIILNYYGQEAELLL